MDQQPSNNTPFLKRVANLEKAVKDLQKDKTCACSKLLLELKKQIEDLSKQVETIKKVLKR